ncbi:hypothetical protein BH11ARM2_BH11ARM2_07200 [soil metagenome]
MVSETVRERFSGTKPEVYTLEPEKAARFKARTMLVPSPDQMRNAISTIPHGETKTLRQLREELAADTGADITCPYAAGLCWRLVAEDAETDGADETPWWRVTADGKPNPKLPGGAERHLMLWTGEKEGE